MVVGEGGRSSGVLLYSVFIVCALPSTNMADLFLAFVYSKQSILCVQRSGCVCGCCIHEQLFYVHYLCSIPSGIALLFE